MVAIFASATALLTPEFVGSFEPERLAAKFVQVEKETGVKFNKTNSTFNIVGHWDAIQIAHKSLKKLVLTLERAPPPPPEYDEPEPEPQPIHSTKEKATKQSEDAGASEKVIPIKGNPKRGRHASLDPGNSTGLPEPVVYFQYQDKSYMSEEVLNLDALLDAFEDNLPDTVKVKKEDLKKILEKNTENMGRPLEKRKAYIQAQAELKAKEEEQKRLQEQHQQQHFQEQQRQQQHEQQQILQGHQHLQDQHQVQGQHIQGQPHQGYQGQPHLAQSQLQQGYPGQPQIYAGQTQQIQAQYHDTTHLNGELVAGMTEHQLPVMETTQEEMEAIDSAQASIEQALEVAVGSMNNNVSENTMSHVNSGADLSTSASMLLTPPTASVDTWAESKFPEATHADSNSNKFTEIKDEIPSSDNDFGGETDDDLSYLDLSHATESSQVLVEPEKATLPEKSKQTAEKPKGKGSKRGRKGKEKNVKAETTEPTDTSKEQADGNTDHDGSDTENVGKRRSRRKSRPIKYTEGDKDGGNKEEHHQEETPPPKKKGARVRKVQVIRNRSEKSKKKGKPDGQDGSSLEATEVKEKGKPKNKAKPKTQDESQKLGRPKSNKVYKCTECDYSSQRRTRWTEHMGRVHGFITARDLERQKKPEFPCEACDKSFIFEKDLKRHNRIVHTAVSHFCKVCQKTYKSKYVFDKHVATHEEGYVQPMFCCQLCPRSFTTKFMLAHHIKSEHLGIKKTYLCPTCGKSFSQIRSYRQHANVHAGIRPFVCETCGKSFTYEKSLKEHRYMHDNLRRFPCKVCGKAFRQYTCLIIHMKVHKDTKDHICASCGKGFTQKQSLIRHERIHTGDKPYTCGICRKAFSDYAVIRKHMMMCHKKDKDNWKDEIITEVKRPQSNHYISGGPGYVPREKSTKISDYVKPSEATQVQTTNLEPGQPMPHMPGQVLPLVPIEQTDSPADVSEDSNRASEDLFRKVSLTDEDAQTALSRLTAVYSGANLYTASNLIQSQELTLTPELKVQQNGTPEQNQITLMPLNYSVSPNYATAVSATRTIDHALSEEAIANYLKAEVCPKQQQKDYAPILAPLSSVVPVSDPQKGQVAFTASTSGDSIISQAALSAWGYTGYPAYYTPANFVQYQGQQN